VFLPVPSSGAFAKLQKATVRFVQVGTKKCLDLEGGGGVADPEAIYNLYLFLKIVIKSCHKYNITLSVTAFIYIQI
jgi:hypothetical protein